MAPFKGHRLALCVASGTTEIQGLSWCAALGVEVPGHRQQQLAQTLIERLLKTHILPLILDFEKSTE